MKHNQSINGSDFFESNQVSNEELLLAFEKAVKNSIERVFESRINYFETALKYCRHSKKRTYILKKLNVLKPAYEKWRKENVSNSD